MKNLMRVIDWTVKAVCLAVLVYLAVIKGPEPVEMVQAKRGLFEFRINSPGVIRSRTRYTVTAFAEGNMRRLSVRIGDEIVQGAILTEILVGENYEPIRAAVSGVVSKVHRGSAGKVERKEPIIEISDPAHMEMSMELPLADAEQVEIGDPFTISSWGGPGLLKGVVTQITKGEKNVVTGELRDVPQGIFRRLGDRSEVPVSIQVAQYPNALKLPVGAVFKPKNSWAVFRVAEDRAREKKITIVNRNHQEVMIGEGLSEGEYVINNPGVLVKDSVRVEMR